MKSDFGMAAASLVILCGTAAAAPTPTTNIRNSFPYPAHDYCFQDRRSVHDILAGRLPREIANAGDPDDLGPGLACFDPINPPTPEMMEEVRRYIEGGYASRYEIGNRWSRGSVAEPIALTWSFVPDGLTVGDAGAPGGAGPSTLFATMDSRFASAGGRATWITQFQSVFNRWQALTGITYTRVRNTAGNDWDDGAGWGNISGTNRGDVRIGMKNIDNANGILAYNSFPDNGDMVIDSSENWAASGNTYRFLRDVLMHEHGHGMGLAHVCPQASAASGGAKLMAPFVDISFDGPQQDDIRGAQANYGDPFEPNDTAATAFDLGSLPAGSTLSRGVVPSPAPVNAALLSLERNGESDYYGFTIDAPRLLNITVTPVGSVYDANPQNTSCISDGTTSDGLAAANLVLEVRNSAGTIVYRTVNANAAGLAESTTGLLVSPAGDHVLRVYESDNPTEVQSYRFTITAQNVNLAPTASDGTFANFVRITWPGTITDAEGYQVMRNSTNTTTNSTQVGSVAAGVLTFDDTSALPGTTYYYFVKARQPGNVNYRYMTGTGDAGFRPAITNTPPVANAGPDQTLTDDDRTGAETVTLNGAASSDAQGPIANYRWAEGATVLANGASATANVSLDVGAHTITLTVTDSGGLTATDTVTVTINPGCFADYNLDGGVDGSDIDSFFQDWELGLPGADTNSDGGVDGADIEAFFDVWTNGGC
jgi:serralysin